MLTVTRLNVPRGEERLSLSRVYSALEALAARAGLDLGRIIAIAVRQAIDGVLEPWRTGDFAMWHLDTDLKTVVGVFAERNIRRMLNLSRGQFVAALQIGKAGRSRRVRRVIDLAVPMDQEVVGVNVKWSILGNHNFSKPDELCLLVQPDDDVDPRFLDVGLVVPREEDFNRSKTRDAKRTMAAAQRAARILWIFGGKSAGGKPLKFMRHPLEDLQLAQHENAGKIERIMAFPKGMQRLRALAQEFQKCLIDRAIIEAVGYGLEEPTRRIRADQTKGAPPLGNVKALSTTWKADRRVIRAIGLEVEEDGPEQWVFIDRHELPRFTGSPA